MWLTNEITVLNADFDKTFPDGSTVDVGMRISILWTNFKNALRIIYAPTKSGNVKKKKKKSKDDKIRQVELFCQFTGDKVFSNKQLLSMLFTKKLAIWMIILMQ